MKVLGLDIGDKWTGVAISDELGMFARPLTTIHAETLVTFLEEIVQKEPISTIVVGYPITLRGTISEQTLKIKNEKEALEKHFPQLRFILQDERLTSKQADTLKKNHSKEDKLAGHARAAAFILSNYLAFARR